MRSPARSAAEALVHTGALAASVRALGPDFQMLAARVRWALQNFEARFDRDEAHAREHYETDRSSTGAGDLYDAVVDLAGIRLRKCRTGVNLRDCWSDVNDPWWRPAE